MHIAEYFFLRGFIVFVCSKLLTPTRNSTLYKYTLLFDKSRI